MTHRILFLFIFLSIQFNLLAQADLTTTISDLAKKIGPVSAAKFDYDQTLSTVDHPYSIKFYISQTNTKGKTSEEEYYFNLADIAPSSVRYQTVKDIIRITIKTKNNQRFIKKIEDGKLSAYVNTIDMAAENAENAREIQQLFKDAIALSEEAIESNLNLENWGDGMNYILSNIKKATIGEATYTYAISQDPVVEPRITIDVKQSGGKNEADEVFRFNLADLNAKKVSVGVSGTTPYINLSTQNKQKYIYTSKNGTQGNYTDNIKLPCEEIDQAREWVAVFKYLISNAEENNKSWMPELSNGEQALTIFSQLVGKVEGKETTYQQTITATCPTVLNQKFDQKGTGVEETYVFNWADLDAKKCKVQISGPNLYLNLSTLNNQKLIQVSKNGEITEYTRSTKIMLPYIETGKAMEMAIEQIIPFCTKALENLASSWTPEEKMDWLKSNIKQVPFRGNDLNQTWDYQNQGDPCSFRLEQTPSNKSITETIEFFGKDIDGKSIKMETSGKEIGLRVGTKNRQKLIKVIEEGEEKPYVSSILIIFDSIENTRIAMAILQSYAEECN